MCTYGRFSYVRRSIGLFLNQDYENKHLLIYNNAPAPLVLDVYNENVTIINNHIDLISKSEYTDVGTVFRDALTYVPSDADYVSIWDDDDIFLENHLSSGVNYLEINKEYEAWRKRYYFYKSGNDYIELLDANSYTEGACIIRKDFLNEIGFFLNTSLVYHHKWYFEAEGRGQFAVAEDLFPTFCIEAGQANVAHISGLSSNDDLNTRNEVKQRSIDFGDGKKLIPWGEEMVKEYLDICFSDFRD